MKEYDDKNTISKNASDEKVPSEIVSSEIVSNEKVPSGNVPSGDVSAENPPKKRKKRFNILNPFGNKYRQVKSDEERMKKTVLFGCLSIVFSILCIALSYPCVWAGIKGIIFAFTHNLGALTMILGLGNIFIAVFSLGAMLIPYFLWFQGIRLVVMQFYCNRRFISWLALLIWIVSVVGIFLFSLESFLTITGWGHIFE